MCQQQYLPRLNTDVVATPNNKQEKYSALKTSLLTEAHLNLWNGRSILKRDMTAMLSLLHIEVKVEE